MIMTEVKSTDKNENVVESLLLPNMNYFRKESVPIEETKNASTWSVVYFESDEENDFDGFNDLIPSTWITKQGSLCWYPMNEHKSTIQKLVKRCVANKDWNCFSIRKIEEGIENYDRGMKMLIKLTKNPNASLYSDLEEKGKGKRLKKTTRFAVSGKENNYKKRQEQTLPPIPKLFDSNNANNQGHKHETFISPNNNVLQDPFNSISQSKTKSKIDKNGENVQKKGCKMSSKKYHKCAYENEETTLYSMADAMCYLSAEVTSCKAILKLIDKNLESFLQTAQEAPKKQSENTKFSMSILDELPLKNLEDLHAMERKLKEDVTFKSELINALHLQVAGESDRKMVTSILRLVLDDNLASLFNWKGQRGTKQKMSNRRIAKTMIEIVSKDYPHLNDKNFGRYAGPWLAQATYRLKKHTKDSNTEKPTPDNSNNSASEGSELSDDSSMKETQKDGTNH